MKRLRGQRRPCCGTHSGRGVEDWICLLRDRQASFSRRHPLTPPVSPIFSSFCLTALSRSRGHIVREIWQLERDKSTLLFRKCPYSCVFLLVNPSSAALSDLQNVSCADKMSEGMFGSSTSFLFFRKMQIGEALLRPERPGWVGGE